MKRDTDVGEKSHGYVAADRRAINLSDDEVRMKRDNNLINI